MAKATKRADGRLVKTIIDPRTGKRKYFYGDTMREINTKIIEYTESQETGRTFGDVADDWRVAELIHGTAACDIIRVNAVW